VIVTFQENPVQLREIAQSFGWDILKLHEQNLLMHLYHSPVEIQPDIHASHIKVAVEQVGARRVIIDSINDIEIATPDKVRFKDYIYALTNEFKMRGITTILTNEISELFGTFQLSDYGVSFIADNVILLRYVELSSRIGRALSIMKVRGSQHSKEIRLFEITSQGIRIQGLIKAVTGVLTGTPQMGNQPLSPHLPLRSRYVLDTIQHLGGSCSLAQLGEATGIALQDMQQELAELQQQGMLLAFDKDNEPHYKATV
jgi:circadian clock protein KaiC